MSNYLRKHLQFIPGYIPGEQPPPDSPIIKLNTNENPYPPSPAVAQVLQNLDSEWLRRYPDPTATPFRQAVSEVLGMPPEWIAVGNGSDELLGVMVRAFVEEGATVAYPMPSYALYRTLAQLQAAQPAEIPYDAEFRFPLQSLIQAQGTLTLVATPNSPVGNVVAIEQLEALAIDLPGLLVIDEAYVDFAETDALSLVRQYPNVLVLRTLSKGYALAGLRLGFVMAHPERITELNKIRDSYAVDAIATLVGTAAIRDQSYKNEITAKVKQSRALLQQNLERLGFQIWPSQGNFLLVLPPFNIDALALQAQLKARGILVRHFNLPQVSDKLRITIGTDAQNNLLCQQLEVLIKSEQHRGVR
jgi:histidinol-phosphate aminotransferase